MNEQLKIIISAEIDKLKKGVADAKKEVGDLSGETEKQGSKITAAMKKVGVAVAAAFSVKAIVDFTKEIVNCSATVAAEQSAYSQIMGNYADTATQKLKAVADETGITETRLTSSMTSMTAKWKGLGYGVEEATTYATRGLTMAADASAFWDMSLDESVSHLNSFINGSYEGGEAIGLFANDTQMAMYAVEQGLISSTKEWANLDEATKQATRLDYAENMMEQSGALGQAAKEAGQYANVQANLTEEWRQFKAQIGTPILNNIVIPAMKVLTTVVRGARAAYQEIQGDIEAFKDKIQSASEWAENHKTALTLIAIGVGAITAAIIAYNAAAIAKVAVDAAETVAIWALIAAENAHAIASTIAATATSAFATAMAFLTSPITLVIAAIAAVIAIIVLCVKHWDTISETVKNVAKAVWEKVKEMKDKVVGFFQNIFDWISNNWQGLLLLIVNPFAGAFKLAYDNCSEFREKVNTVFTNIKDGIKTRLDGAKETVNSIFTTIKSKITTTINGARDAVKNAVDKIKNVMNFKWSLPKLKMPKITISGKFKLNPPSAPKFSISWNKLGGIFDKPTLFNYGGSLQGLGEDGAEAVVPLEKNTKWLDKIADKISAKQGQVPIVLQVDGKTFAQVSIDSINALTRQRGNLGLNLI